MNPFAEMPSDQLLSELDAVEEAIGLSSAFDRFRDEAGRIRVRVTGELLALVEREQLVVSELRRRHRSALAA